MVEERNGLLGRLRDALRPQVVGPQKEYVRHTEEEREELLTNLFGPRPEAETEPAGRDGR